MLYNCLRLIARYLDNLLELVLKHISRYTLKKSFEFVDEVKHQKDNDTFLCLFDVPVNEVIDICADKKPNFLKKKFHFTNETCN